MSGAAAAARPRPADAAAAVGSRILFRRAIAVMAVRPLAGQRDVRVAVRRIRAVTRIVRIARLVSSRIAAGARIVRIGGAGRGARFHVVEIVVRIGAHHAILTGRAAIAARRIAIGRRLELRRSRAGEETSRALPAAEAAAEPKSVRKCMFSRRTDLSLWMPARLGRMKAARKSPPLPTRFSRETKPCIFT